MFAIYVVKYTCGEYIHANCFAVHMYGTAYGTYCGMCLKSDHGEWPRILDRGLCLKKFVYKQHRWEHGHHIFTPRRGTTGK